MLFIPGMLVGLGLLLWLMASLEEASLSPRRLIIAAATSPRTSPEQAERLIAREGQHLPGMVRPRG